MIPYDFKTLLFGLIVHAALITLASALLDLDGRLTSVTTIILLIGYADGWLSRTFLARGHGRGEETSE